MTVPFADRDIGVAFVQSTLGVALGDVLAFRRNLELPGGVDRKIPIVDLRWVNVSDLIELTGVVLSGPFSPWRSWLGLVLSGEILLVLPLSLRPDILKETARELGLSAEGSLWPSPRTGGPTYGVFFDGEVGRVWAISKGQVPLKATFRICSR